MKFTLDQNGLSLLHEKGKLIGHLMSYVSKTSFILDEEDESLTIFLKGPFLQYTETIPLSSFEGDVKHFEVDYTKFMNALSKMTFAEEIEISVTDKQLRVNTNGSTDIISLGISPILKADAQSLLDDLNTLYSEIVTEKLTLELKGEILDSFRLAHSLFTTSGTNNAIIYDEDSIMYADRSVVLQVTLGDTEVSGRYEIHKNILALVPLVEKFSKTLLFSSKREFAWSDGDSVLVIGSEPCEIAVPSKDELENIYPSDPWKIEVSRDVLETGLEFFSGFYEASSWKPITFVVDEKEGLQLEYSHPTTELKKNISTISCEGSASFTVSSETLEKVLDAGFESEKIYIEFNEDGPGVRVYFEDHKVDSLLAKLIDNM